MPQDYTLICLNSGSDQNTSWFTEVQHIFVKTITLNELVPILHARGVRGAIIKMDIEGSESFALESGSQIFDLFDIPVVQMEWLKVRSFPDRVKFLIDFFTKRNYVPKTFQCQPLDIKNIQVWPNDLCWTEGNISCC
ncbi:unnamed protein product [Adineta steineri]|uniref:Methyltransferase FkbM domain-containing protein n=1 Tax=Adineta steineri TaxID=433720 RepID=A0A815BZ84_9BILA|nr:unnamed protein product [Adineta steineri]